MTCNLTQTTLHGYLDGELDALRATDFEEHLKECPSCQAALAQMQSLRASINTADLYTKASPQLRSRIRHQLAGDTGTSDFSAPRLWRGWFVPIFAALSVVVVFWLTLRLVEPHTQSARIAAELIDAHVRSLQPGHLTDVQSTDQHTVKPWFDGKLDFIPPVADYSQEGFPLIGGRLDVIDGHNVAAIVYSRRKHLINLFVWPSREGHENLSNSGSHQGYNWIAWQAGDMSLCLVSDVSSSDLRELQGLIRP